MGVFLFSFNAIAPMLICTALGWFVMARGHMDEHSISVINTLCFRYLLAFHVFNSTYKIDFRADFTPAPMLFCITGVIILLLVSWIVFPRVIREPARQCSYIVASFRSNNIIYALPLAASLFGDAGVKAAAMLVPVTIILFNFFTVVIFSYYAGSRDKAGMRATLRRTAIDIVKNPLIFGSVAGVALSLLRIPLPEFLQNGINNVAGIATPLSLLLLGAQLDFKRLRGNIGQVLAVSLFRLVLVPVIVVPIAVMLGFRGAELGSLMVIFAAPLAVTNLVMARNYNIDAEFMAQSVILSTVLSMGTIFCAISILRALALI